LEEGATREDAVGIWSIVSRSGTYDRQLDDNGDPDERGWVWGCPYQLSM
jgi:hypothetical protein